MDAGKSIDPIGIVSCFVESGQSGGPTLRGNRSPFLALCPRVLFRPRCDTSTIGRVHACNSR
jgi:hypothetical protein